MFERGSSAVRYQMRQKILSIGDDYWIENTEGEHIYRVDGKVLRLRHTLDLEDLDGGRLCRVQTRVMHIHEAMDIEGPDGHRWARVHKAMTAPLRERWKAEHVESGPDMEVHGNVVEHEYEIEAEGRMIAEDLQEVVRRPRPLWSRNQPGPGPGPDTCGHDRHRLDGPPPPSKRRARRRHLPVSRPEWCEAIRATLQ